MFYDADCRLYCSGLLPSKRTIMSGNFLCKQTVPPGLCNVSQHGSVEKLVDRTQS